MSRTYKCINKDKFSNGVFSIIPIRDEDKYDILKWRNEQIDILRQSKLLTIEEQEIYFKNVVDKLFEIDKPKQLLFSFLENDVLIGYGGLVHIDWDNKTAEVSFLTETSRNRDNDIFINDWINYLSILTNLATDFLNFNSINTFAYDLRPNLYIALEKSDFIETNRLTNFIEIKGKSVDAVIHNLELNSITFRLAKETDVDLYFHWANDEAVRKFSFQQNKIDYETHVTWFNSKVSDSNFKFFVFLNKQNQSIGQVRINKNEDEVIIGITIDVNHRGFGYGTKMLRLACNNYYMQYIDSEITAYIKVDNKPSVSIFKKAGFIEQERIKINGFDCIKLILNKNK